MKRIAKFWVRIFQSYLIEEELSQKLREADNRIYYLEDMLLASKRKGDVNFPDYQVEAECNAILFRKQKENLFDQLISSK